MKRVVEWESARGSISMLNEVSVLVRIAADTIQPKANSSSANCLTNEEFHFEEKKSLCSLERQKIFFIFFSSKNQKKDEI